MTLEVDSNGFNHDYRISLEQSVFLYDEMKILILEKYGKEYRQLRVAWYRDYTDYKVKRSKFS